MKRALTLILVWAMGAWQVCAQTYLSQSIEYEGETRDYKIYIPATYDGANPVPLVFSFHGGNGTIDDQIAIGDMSSIADTANFIAVYPQALPDPNDGGSTNWIRKGAKTVDDVYFVDALIDSIAGSYAINLDRVYACGYSLGGEFTFELACQLNSRIAAVGVVARTMQKNTFDNCSPSHPTGVITILGTDDFISNYDGVWWAGVQYYLSADETHDFWAAENDCDEAAKTVALPNSNTSDGSTVERNTWATATGCTYVEELKVLGGGHDWPGSFGNMDVDATQEIWRFVSQYDINGLMGCGTTSLQENKEVAGNINAYPNPLGHVLSIEREPTGAGGYSIYSTTGKLVLTGSLDVGTNSIDVSSLPQGLYRLLVGGQAVSLIKME